jgi:ABC-type transport system involved in multi-copper enzyme maturation permease subunit
VNEQVRAVVIKEFREFRRNKMIVLTMGLLPVFFLGVPIAGALALHGDVPQTAYEVAVGQAILLFFIVPTILPTTLAAYAVIGEREQGTLEPVLTTPVEHGELLLGKVLAATVPSVVLAWSFFAIFVVLVRFFAAPQVVDLVWQLDQFVAQLLIDPVLAMSAIIVGLMVSVRSSDIRVAQQLSGLAMLPVFGVASLAAFRVVVPTVPLFFGAALIMGLADLYGWRKLNRMFDRERLLTRFGKSA